MSTFARSTIKYVGMLATLFCLVGCWGPTWPHRRLTVDLSQAHASTSEVATAANAFLISRGLSDAGKAGQDAINNSTTVLNYQGADGLIVSIYLNRERVVLISFDQDRQQFSDDAQRLFDDLVSELGQKWPGSIIREPTSVKTS